MATVQSLDTRLYIKWPKVGNVLLYQFPSIRTLFYCINFVWTNVLIFSVIDASAVIRLLYQLMFLFIYFFRDCVSMDRKLD